MMTAERWYEYQDNYKRYGFDMKPRPAPLVKKPEKTAITAKEKIGLIFSLILIGALCIGIIISTAYAAGVKYETNRLIKENNLLRGEIENLNVKIKSATNIETIERRAVQELGMVQPGPSQFVFLLPGEEAPRDFAMILKEQAYN